MINNRNNILKNKNILALDPSLSSTGWAVFDDKNTCPEVNKIQTDTNDGNTDERITIIVDKIQTLAFSYNIRHVIFEDGYIGKSAKTGLQLAELRGAIIYILRAQGYDVYHMMPSQIRKTFGLKGNAKKEEVANAVLEKYPELENKIGPYSDKQNKKKTSDMYDAVSIGEAFKHTL